MKVLIVGCGLSGLAAKDYLEGQGISTVFAKEKDINYKGKFDEEYLDRLLSGLSFIVTSPGISPKIPLLKEARKRKIKIIGEFELGASALKGDIIAVTGTNGKTTTVSLIYYLLKGADTKINLGGNIGVPVSSFAKSSKVSDISVLECSSFQLEGIKHFHPHIAAILNFSVDHLSRHGTMKKYIEAKSNITKYQTEGDFLLINADCETLMENLPKTNAKVLYFSTKRRVEGCYIKRGSIYFNDNHCEKKLVSSKGIKLIGEHNLSNILCGVLAVYLETKNIKLVEGISRFVGVPHRTEYVKTISGIEFFNDSKATNISSTLVAVSSFKQNIHLILGGSDKGYEFDELFEKLPQNVKSIAVCGQTAKKILRAAKKFGYLNIKQCASFGEAVKTCYKNAKNGEVVLLSPACASFDCFKNYEERGMVFRKIVEEILSYENALGKSEKET